MRISKGEQTTVLQEDALAKAAVERTYRDMMSGVRDDRPQFQAMLDFARPGDTIVVWRLDRLGRSLKHLIETVMGLQARGINFRQGWCRPRREIVCGTGTGILCEIRYGASFLSEETHVSAGDDVEECIFEEASYAVYECTCLTRDICSWMKGDGHDAFVPVSPSEFIREEDSALRWVRS